MRVKVLIFGQLTDITRLSEMYLDDVSDSEGLIHSLHRLFPALADSKYALAVDKKVITGNIPFDENSTVALLPPFSGG